MRNLKRVLSLALALVMILGMMITGAGAASADFSDSAEINYTEAVDVMTGLNVLQGSDDDKDGVMDFNPDGLLTREQAAKIIAYIVLGKEGADKLPVNQVTTFEDVAAGRWSAGFIAWCAGQGILTGDEHGNFNPENYLTGLQFGKMLLVAAGYKSDMEGYEWNANWATNIGSDMVANGIDLTQDGVLMANYLTREQAAQMMLQALDMQTVYYATGNVVGNIGPFDAGQTFAQKWFPGLERFDGVVTANEYADLNSSVPLRAGKTEIDGKEYTGATLLTDIGESRQGWANYGKILYIEDTGRNVVLSTGDATTLNAKFKKDNGIDDGYTEYFANFEQTGEWTSEYLLTYGYKDDKLDDETAAPHSEKKVRAGVEIDISELRAVFSENSGYVYLGTKTTDNPEDYSSTMSWRKFQAEYLDVDYNADFNVTENGEWLKVVDNDGDGTAEYVFGTWFAMSVVEDIDKRGNITIPYIETDPDEDGWNADRMEVLDDLEEEDVVIYTIIDGVAWVELADFFEATVKKYNYKNEIMTTTDGDEYGQSGIWDYTYYVYDHLEKLDDVTYIFYQDYFDYIRVAALPDSAADQYVLLTEFYNTGSNMDNLISTKTLIAETVTVDGEVEEYEVGTRLTNLVSDGLLDRYASKNANNVEPVAGTDPDPVNSTAPNGSWTNVAAYSLKDDVISLDTAYDIVLDRWDDVKAETDYIALETAIAKGQRHFDIADTDRYLDTGVEHEGDYVNVTQNTVIFYVLGTNSNEIEAVDVVTGYANIVPVVNVNAVYAVADRTSWDTEDDDYYWTAKILVIEAEDYAETYRDSLAFVYSNPEKETSRVFSLEDIAISGALDTLYVRNDFQNGQYVEESIEPLAFYPTHEDKDGYDVLTDSDAVDPGIQPITSGYAAWRIYAAEFKRVQKQDKMDYMDVVINGAVKAIAMTEDAVAYALSTGRNNTYDAAELDLNERENEGDKIIYVTNSQGAIIYVIDVDASFTGTGAAEADAYTALSNLWQDIVDDALYTEPTTVEEMLAVLSALDPITAENYEAAKTALDDAKALTTDDAESAAEWQELQDAIAALETAILNYARTTKIAELQTKVTNSGVAEDAGVVAALNAAVAAINAETDVDAIENYDDSALDAAIAAAQTAAGNAEQIAQAKAAALQAMDDFIKYMTGSDYDLYMANGLTDYTDSVGVYIDTFCDTPEKVAEVFTYDENASPKWTGGDYPNDDNDYNWMLVLPTGVSTSGNFKQDVMNIIDKLGGSGGDVKAVLDARTAAQTAMEAYLTSTFTAANYTSTDWAALEQIVSTAVESLAEKDTTDAIDAVQAQCENDLAQKAIDIAETALNVTTTGEGEDAVKAASIGSSDHDDTTTVTGEVTAKVGDVTVALADATTNLDGTTYTLTISMTVGSATKTSEITLTATDAS